MFAALDSLRDFMFERGLPARGRPRASTSGPIALIRDLFAYFLDHPDEMPPEYHRAPGDLPTRVADYIAGMTDRYALRTYERLFLPRGWLLDEPSAGEGEVAVAGRIRHEDIEAVKERTDIVAARRRSTSRSRRPVHDR